MKIKLKNKKALFSLSFITFLISSKIAKAFDFAEKSGLDSTANKTGHKEQALFNTSEGLETGTATIIGAILSLVGVLFMVFLIYGGILWMTAGGNDEQVSKARKIMIESIVGIAIVMLAYVITSFIVSIFVAS